MWKKVIFLFVVAAGAAHVAAEPPIVPAGATVDNASLMPKVLSDDQVKMEGMSPDWVKTLIMVQFRIETATSEGTFQSAVKVLDHYAHMGVNGLWINPIWERGSKGNGYGNRGPNTIEPLLTGAKDVEGSYAVVHKFVEEAHRRNIRVIFDIVVWGTHKDSPLVTAHPEFYRRKDGNFLPAWGGWGFDWKSEALQEWFTKQAVMFIEKTGADGFRVDLAPNTSGYFFKRVRDELYAKGHKIIIVSEGNNERKDTFDFEQIGVSGWTEERDYPHPEHLKAQKAQFGVHNECFLRHNIVDLIRSGEGIGKATLQQQGKGGMFRFYTSNLLTHDDNAPFVKGSRVRMGYTGIFAPYIPMWWIGEEWNNPLKRTRGGVMYFNEINWSVRDGAGKPFFEDVKRFIRIRRSYPEIFEYFPDNARQANIAKVDSNCNGQPNPLQAYARFAAGKAVLVVPNSGEKAASVEVRPDFKAIGLDEAKGLKVTDLLTGRAVELKAGAFMVQLPADYLGVYLVERR